MTVLTLMSYNIENMSDLFYKGKVNPEHHERAMAIAAVIRAVNPDLLGIVEAAKKRHHHENFLEETGLTDLQYQVAMSTHSRRNQELVFYYRAPFSLLSLDQGYEFYDEWIEDIDDDGIREVCSFERRPLEGMFAIEGSDCKLTVILTSIKSKGVFTVNDLLNHQRLSLANRKRQLAQCKKLRQRADQLLELEETSSFIIMGDFNDDPGLDSYERMIGASAIETLMGSVFEPQKILHNALWHMSQGPQGKELWTTEFNDRIVANAEPHRTWIDHIMVSPVLINEKAPLCYVSQSGAIGEKTAYARMASDHFPVYCRLQLEK